MPRSPVIFGVPVVFLSGDQTIGEDAKHLLGSIEVAVEQAIGFHAARMMHPEDAQRLIRNGVKRGVERRGEIKPYRLSHPVSLEIRFNDVVSAELVSYLPGVERPRGNTIVFTGADMSVVSRFHAAIGFLNTFN